MFTLLKETLNELDEDDFTTQEPEPSRHLYAFPLHEHGRHSPETE